MRRTILALALPILCAPTLCSAQALPDSTATFNAPATGQKSVATARVLAIVPGLGHAYAGEGKRGLAVAGGLVGFTVASGFVLAAGCVAEALDPYSDGECGDGVVGSALSMLIVAGWGVSIYDAGSAARRTNAKRATALQGESPLTLGLTRRPTASGHDARAITVGMRFTVR